MSPYPPIALRRIIRSCCIASLASAALCATLAAQSLAESVAATLDQYPSLRVQEQRVQLEQDKLSGEKAKRRPKLSLDLRGGEERFADGDDDYVFGETGNAALRGQQLLFDGGNTRGRITEAQANLRSSQETLRQSREELALETALAYVDVIKYSRLLSLAEQSVYLHRDALDKIEQKFQAGAGPQADVTLVRGRLAMSQASLESRRRQLKLAQTSFRRLTGLLPGQFQEPNFPLAALPESVDAVSFESNPQVRAAHSRLQANHAKRKIARSAYRPRLNFVVEGDLAASDRYETLREDASALVTLSFDLVDGGRRHAEVAMANTRLLEADWQLRDTLLNAETAFARAWTELLSIEERIALLRDHRDAIETVASAYHQQFELGKRPLINLLDIENELSSARASVEEERLNRLQTAYRVLAALGTLTENIK